MKANLRRACWLAALLPALLATGTASAQVDYPTRPIRVLYGYPAGGAGDVIGRIVTERMGHILGQQFVMENRIGAGGTIAAGTTARSDPDGYTIHLVIESHAISPSLYPNLTYDPDKDFRPLGMVGRSPLLLVVHKSSAAKSVADLVELGKTKPKSVTFATFGPGTPQHFGAFLLAKASGADFSDVPYRGGAPAINDLVAGHIQAFFMTQGSALPFTNEGTLRALGAAAARRLPHYPDLPTLQEAGYDVEVQHWFGFVAPAQTPPEVAKKLERALSEALAMPAVKTKLDELGLVLTPLNSTAFGEFIRSETTKWSQLIRENGLKLDQPR